REQLGMENLGQNLEPLDGARARAAEVRRAVDGVRVPRCHGLQPGPHVRQREATQLVERARETEAARHQHENVGVVVSDARPGHFDGILALATQLVAASRQTDPFWPLNAAGVRWTRTLP